MPSSALLPTARASDRVAHSRGRSMITDQASASQSKPDSGQEPTNVERRSLIGAGVAALLTAACSSPTENGQRLSSSGLVTAGERDEGADEGRSEIGRASCRERV